MILPHFTRFDRKGQTKTEENAQKPFRFACNRAVEYRIDRRSSAPAVYCRSGNRSKTASSTLAELGYTNIYEFGGINTWPYETEP